MPKPETDLLAHLNGPQRQAALHGEEPLLLIAGAGTGKTNTLVHRVASLIEQGADPRRILLLTFTRRAAAEMLRRVEGILQSRSKVPGGINRIWGGTFHAVGTRILRRYGEVIGLPPEFTILDRGDTEDLLGVIRTELALERSGKPFPSKGACQEVY